MNRRLISIMVLLFVIVNSNFGQKTITGSVFYKEFEEEKVSIGGVIIAEKGTSNTTTSDIDGRFTIIINDTSNVLVFSFIGCVTREVTINDIWEIEVLLKPYIIYEAWDQKVRLYAQSGVINTPFGARFDFSIPIVSPLAIEFRLAYLTDFKLNEKISANFSLSQYRFQIGSWGWLYGYVDFGFRQLSIQNSIDMDSYSIENYARIYGHNLILGLGKNVYSPENAEDYSGYGILAGYKKEFRKLDFITLTYKMGFYKEAFEYHFQIEKPMGRVRTFITYNKIGDYQEIMLGIGFEFTYFFKYQKDANKYATQH